MVLQYFRLNWRLLATSSMGLGHIRSTSLGFYGSSEDVCLGGSTSWSIRQWCSYVFLKWIAFCVFFPYGIGNCLWRILYHSFRISTCSAWTIFHRISTIIYSNEIYVFTRLKSFRLRHRKKTKLIGFVADHNCPLPYWLGNTSNYIDIHGRRKKRVKNTKPLILMQTYNQAPRSSKLRNSPPLNTQQKYTMLVMEFYISNVSHKGYECFIHKYWKCIITSIAFND